MHVLVLGDANADICATLGHFPAEGGDTPVRELLWASGGAGVNVAAALAHLGAPTRLLAAVGTDPASTVALAAAAATGVDLSAIQRHTDQATGLCYAAISPGGERTFLSFRGANPHLHAPDTVLDGVNWLHVCGHSLLEGTQRDTALRLWHAAGTRAIARSLDLCLPLIAARPSDIGALATGADLLLLNQHEADTLGALPALPPHGMLALKHGAAGCTLHRDGARQHIPAFAVAARDTTGCGDAFAAAFIYASLRGLPVEQRGRLANAFGAIIATRPGAAVREGDAERVWALAH